MDTTNDMLGLLQSSILRNDVSILGKILDQLSLSSVETSENWGFLERLMNICMQTGSTISAKFLYKYWSDNFYSSDGDISLFSILFTRKEFNVDELIFIKDVTSDQNFTLLEVITDLNTMGKDIQPHQAISAGEFLWACSKCIKVFGTPEPDFIEYIYNLTKNENGAIADFFGKLMRRYGAFANIPDYMMNPFDTLDFEDSGGSEESKDSEESKESNEEEPTRALLPKESDITIPEYQIDPNLDLPIGKIVEMVLNKSEVVIYKNPVVSLVSKDTTGSQNPSGSVVSKETTGIKTSPESPVTSAPVAPVTPESEVTTCSVEVELTPEEKAVQVGILKAQLTETLSNLKREGKLVIKNYVIIKQLEDLQNDDELFRLLGPVSPITDAGVDDMKYGGERMFISQRYVYDDGTDSTDVNIETPWFTGSCEYCNLRIRRKYHAVRQPVDTGGWIGCFCSWKCVRDKVEKVDFTDHFTLELCDLHEEKMEEIGIYDRIPDEDYVDYLFEYYKSMNLPGELKLIYVYDSPCEDCISFEEDIDKYRDLIPIVSIDAKSSPIDLSEIGVNNIPAFIIYKGDIPISVMEGYYPEDLMKSVSTFKKL